mgnify:FL=1
MSLQTFSSLSLPRVSSNKAAVPALLLIPVLVLMMLTIIGYLYFTQQQIRASLISEEVHQVTRVAQVISQQLSRSQRDAVTLTTDIAALDVSPGETQWRESVASSLIDLFEQDDEYIFATFVTKEEGEIVRVINRGGTVQKASDERLISDAIPMVSKIGLVLRDQPLASVFMLLRTEQGVVTPYTPVLTTVTRQGSGAILATAKRVDSLLEAINNEPANAMGELWLLNPLGDWVAGTGVRRSEDIDRAENENDSDLDQFNFWLDGTLLETARKDYPDLWAIVRSEVSGTAMVSDGQIAFSNVCARLNCEPRPGSRLAELINGWKVVSYVPAASLSSWSLLAAQPDRWLPMVSLLGLVALISAIGAWYIGALIVRQRRDEGRLQQATLLQHAFFEKNPEIMFVKNLDGTYYLANEMCRRLAGRPEADFSGRSGVDLYPEDASSSMAQQDMQIIESEEAMEFHSQWERDGDLAYFKTLRFPIYDQDRKLIAVGGIANDVTEQVHSRHALLENEKLLRTFIESAPDAVLISDIHGSVTLVNRQAELIFGFGREEMMSKSLFELVSGLTSERINEALRSANEPKSDMFRDTMQSTGCGNADRTFPVEFSLAPVTTDEGALIICLLRDTSEKALMETQLRQSQKMEAVGKLTGGMAHDFNNLLGIIIGNITLALKQLPEDDKNLIKRLETVMKAADRGAELTKRMLAIARRQPLQPKPVVINSTVEELSLMLPQTLGTDIEMKLDLTPDLPSILVDESGFEAMLLNLAINSRDAMPEGGTFTIRTGSVDHTAVEKVLPKTRVEKGDYVEIMVSDSGEGMSDDALSKAFEPFFTTKAKDKGTGLGLAMIYGFVKQSRGFIVLRSVLGIGTSVHIYLPVMDDSEHSAADAKQAGEESGIRGEGRVILLVDDETELLRIAEAYLQDLGFKVISATSGKEALEAMESLDRVDLLLTDVVMPGGMNGVALAREVTSRDPSIAVLYASGFPTGVIEENSKVILDAPLLHKPYSLNALSLAMCDVLEQANKRN